MMESLTAEYKCRHVILIRGAFYETTYDLRQSMLHTHYWNFPVYYIYDHSLECEIVKKKDIENEVS